MTYIRHPNTQCIACNKAIYRRPFEIAKNNGHVFCTAACYGSFISKESPCLMCGKPILAKFNKKNCSRACANKYRTGIKYKMNRPRDKVVNERSIKLRVLNSREKRCEKCGYDKVEVLHVHHLDRNHQNNVLTNLKLLCPNCHYEEHYLKKSWLKEINLPSQG